MSYEQWRRAETAKTNRAKKGDDGLDKEFYLLSDSYMPNRLMNYLLEELRVKRDCDLAEKLGLPSASISAMRTRRQGVSARVQLRILELLPSLSLAELQRIAGLPKGA